MNNIVNMIVDIDVDNSAKIEKQLYDMRFRGESVDNPLTNINQLYTLLEVSVYFGQLHIAIILIKYGALITKQVMQIAFDGMKRGVDTVIFEYQYNELKARLCYEQYIEYIKESVEKSYYEYNSERIFAERELRRWLDSRHNFCMRIITDVNMSNILKRRYLGEDFNVPICMEECVDIKQLPIDIAVKNNVLNDVRELITYGAKITNDTKTLAQDCVNCCVETEVESRQLILSMVNLSDEY